MPDRPDEPRPPAAPPAASAPPPAPSPPAASAPPPAPPPAPALPHAAPIEGAPPEPVGPVAPAERLDTLDVLRGFALLGILLVNVELFRGPSLFQLMVGESPVEPGADAVRDALVGWLVSGKFISSFAMLFGVGAAIIAERSMAAGRPTRPLLARRYAWLMVFGLAHMFLLFPGDILFAYGLAGLVLLAFVFVRARTALWWSVGIVAALAVGSLGLAAVGAMAPEIPQDDPFTEAFERFFEERYDDAVAAHTTGGPVDQVRARAWESLFVQTSTLVLLPWIVALFLFGFAAWRSGVLAQPDRRAAAFRRAALVGIPVGLVLNVPLIFAGTLGAGAATGLDDQANGVVVLLITAAQLFGAPVLAVGYLGALGWACERPGVVRSFRPLRQAGRMALTGYLLQSALAAGFFSGLRFYGQLTGLEALAVVGAIWVVVLGACSLWLRFFDRGPVERLWRRLTYGPRRA